MKRSFFCFLLVFLVLAALLPVVRAADRPVNPAEERLIAAFVAEAAEGEPYACKIALAAVIRNRLASPDYPDAVTAVVEEAGFSGRRLPQKEIDAALSAWRTAEAGIDPTDGATRWAHAGTSDAARLRVTFAAGGMVFGE